MRPPLPERGRGQNCLKAVLGEGIKLSKKNHTHPKVLAEGQPRRMAIRNQIFNKKYTVAIDILKVQHRLAPHDGGFLHIFKITICGPYVCGPRSIWMSLKITQSSKNTLYDVLQLCSGIKSSISCSS